MEVQVSLQDCVEMFKEESGCKWEEPNLRAAYILAAHTLEALAGKKKKWFKKKVNIKVELESESDESNSIS